MRIIQHIIKGADGYIYIITKSGGMIKGKGAEDLKTIIKSEHAEDVEAVAIDEAKALLQDMERDAKKQAEEDDARNRCKAYAEELDAIASGRAYICPHCGEMVTAEELDESEHEDEDGNTLCTCPHCGADFERDDAETASIYDYFNKNDIYNIEYRIDGQNDLRSVEIMIACGGPNIYIDTGKNAVLLRWWGTSAQYPINSDTAAAVEEYARELRGEY